MPTDRYLVSSMFDYDMGGGVNAFVEATFAQTRTDSEIEPFAHSHSDLNIGGIPVDNPFVPQAIRDAVLAAGDDVIEYRRRMTEVGQRGARRHVIPTASSSASRATWRKTTSGRRITPSAAWMTPSGAAVRSTSRACAMR